MGRKNTGFRLSITCCRRDFRLKEFLKDVIREQPSPRSEADARSVVGQQTIVDQPGDCFHGLCDRLRTEFLRERVNVHTLIHAEPEKPRFFMLAGRWEPGGFQRCWACEILL